MQLNFAQQKQQFCDVVFITLCSADAIQLKLCWDQIAPARSKFRYVRRLCSARR